MKKFKLSTLLLAVSVLMVITSCKKTEVDPVTSKSSATDVSQNTLKSADLVEHYRETIDLSSPGWSEFNACSGGYIKITKGIWHVDMQFTVSEKKVTMIDHSNVSDYKLIDLTTGVEYTGSYVSNYSEIFDKTGTGIPDTWTGTLKILLTTPGKGNNGVLLVDYHGTVTADGVWRVYFSNERSVCQ